MSAPAQTGLAEVATQSGGAGERLRRPIVDAGAKALAFLTLASLPGVGYWRLRSLVDRAEREEGISLEALLTSDDGQMVADTFRASGVRVTGFSNPQAWPPLRARAEAAAAAIIDKLQRIGAQLVFANDPAFPRSLHDLKDRPSWLFIQGDLAPLHRPAVAIVGTREPSADGLFLTRFVGGCLPFWQVPTVSGLAAGVDALAHQLSLRMTVPTIAVLGHGLLEEYPRGSMALRQSILQTGGAVVTEYLPRQKPDRQTFVRRNRLQAALGQVLIPVEWRARSGTAHTVGFANELGRAVACLHYPGQDAVPFGFVEARRRGLFTVPGEEDLFRQFVADALQGGPALTAVPPPVQGSLF